MASIAIFVLTGILGQLLPLIEAWRRLRNAFRCDTAQESSVSPTADPEQLEASESTVGVE
ncbi:hypothetical protein ACFVIM_00715 [Streptomyces sp. NPDC057638]|uniref:hypothetical protein n=1 Tax=Streptomyces sp. NPDC057638 TaxID=3346190 RepID=UPI0036AB4E94